MNFLRTLSRGRTLAFLSPILFATSCSQYSSENNELNGFRGRFSASAFVFKNGDESQKILETLPPGDVYVAVIKQINSPPKSSANNPSVPAATSIAFAIGGSKEDSAKVLRGLGLDLPSDSFPISVETLNQYNVTQQPNLYTANPGGLSNIEAFYKVIDQKIQDGERPRSGYYVRFSGTGDQLFSVGCKEIVEALGQMLENAIPITEATLPSLAGWHDKDRAYISRQINCNAEKTSDLPAPQSNGQKNFPNLALEKLDVFKTRLSTSVFHNGGLRTYIVGTSKDKKLSFSSQCEILGRSAEFFKAFGFPDAPANIPEVFDRNSPLFRNSSIDQQPLFQCHDTEEEQFGQLAQVFRTVNTARPHYFVRFSGDQQRDKLYRLGCQAMEDFFVISSTQSIGVTVESVDHLVDEPGMLINIPCHETKDTHLITLNSAFADVVGRTMTEGESNYWLDFFRDAKGSENLAQVFRLELGKRIVNSESSQNSNDKALREELITRAIRDGKLNNQFNPSVDNGEAYAEEKDYFRYYIVQQTPSPKHLELGLYKGIKSWVGSKRIGSRASVNNSYRKVYGCYPQQNGVSCPSTLGYKEFTKQFYGTNEIVWTEAELIKSLEQRLQLCATGLTPGKKDSCYYDFEILVDNACKRNTNACKNLWMRPMLLGEEKISSSNIYYNPYISRGGYEPWVSPHLQGILCYMHSYVSDPKRDCTFRTDEPRLSDPWKNL